MVLEVEGPSTPIVSPMDKKTHSGFSASIAINRKDFGIGANFPDAVVSEEVKLTIDLEVAKQ